MTELMYRYSCIPTILAMLKSQELWFSDLRYMNDFDEYAAGYRIATEIVAGEYPMLLDALKEIAPDQMGPRFMGLICSFSREGDCLSMWRGYGDDGRGAAIGYSIQAMKQNLLFARYLEKGRPLIGKPLFFPVIYDEGTFRRELRRQIEMHLKLPEGQPEEEARTLMEVRIAMLKPTVARLSFLYKNDFFIDEREIRGFIEIGDGVSGYDLGTRQSDFGDTSYHRANTTFNDIPSIRQVVLGPRCKLTLEQMRATLIESGLNDVIVKQSRGTYRGT